MEDRLEEIVKSVRKERDDLSRHLAERAIERDALIKERDTLQWRYDDRGKTIKRLGRMVRDYEAGSPGKVERLRAKVRKLEAERLQQAIDWDDLDDEYQKVKAENAKLREKLNALKEPVLDSGMGDNPTCAVCGGQR